MLSIAMLWKLFQNDRGNAAFYLRKSAKLSKEMQAPKKFDTDYDLFTKEENAFEVSTELEEENWIPNKWDAIMKDENKELKTKN